jgi:hypothetical protein
VHRPTLILTGTITAAAAALTILLAVYADQLTPVKLVVAVALMLLAAATTVHAIVRRPGHRQTIDEAYMRGYRRASDRLTRYR